MRDVIDPELGFNIVDLGMMRDVEERGDDVVVSMVLTSMSCPFTGLFVEQVKEAAGSVEGVGEVEVRFDPRRPWSPKDITGEVRDELMMMGLLPFTFEDAPAA